MTERQHAHRCWVLVDPIQDYEESLEILGVYGSDKAAKFAAREHIKSEPCRNLEAQEWIGDQLASTWEWDWTRRRWRTWRPGTSLIATVQPSEAYL